MNLYQENLMDHYRHPRNRGKLDHTDFSSDQFNPSCGDRIEFFGEVKNDQLAKVSFLGSGCVISQATASMLSESMLGKDLAYILALDAAFMISLVGITLGPTRTKCALLPLEALQEGVKKYRDGL